MTAAPQNIPGTSDEYPNWRIPLCDGEGRPVLLEDLPGLPLVRAVAAAAASGTSARLGVALAAAERAGHVVAALGEQPPQRRRRVGPLDVLVGERDRLRA